MTFKIGENMSYPKPLSEKTLARKYAEAGLTTKQKDFLHAFFDAAVNLYGTVPIRHLWEIYKDLSTRIDIPSIRQKDLVAFSGIARREEHSYYVFEEDELYDLDTEEPSKPLDRELVAREIMGSGYGKRMVYYQLTDAQTDKPYFIPDDFLTYATTKQLSREEKKLKDFLGRLKADAKELVDMSGHKKKSNHVGKRLSEFSFLSHHEEFQVKYLSGEIEGGPKRNEKKLNKYLEDRKGPELEKLLRDIHRKSVLGLVSPTLQLKWITSELRECGVLLSKKDLEKLVQLFMDYHNHTHLYSNRGWKPVELVQRTMRRGPLTISLGPGIQQAIKEGKIDKKELEAMFKEKGVKFQYE